MIFPPAPALPNRAAGADRTGCRNSHAPAWAVPRDNCIRHAAETMHV